MSKDLNITKEISTKDILLVLYGQSFYEFYKNEFEDFLTGTTEGEEAENLIYKEINRLFFNKY